MTATTDEPITCVVADDHPAVLEAVALFLEHGGINVLARAVDGEGRAAHALRPAPLPMCRSRMCFRHSPQYWNGAPNENSTMLV